MIYLYIFENCGTYVNGSDVLITVSFSPRGLQ